MIYFSIVLLLDLLIGIGDVIALKLLGELYDFENIYIFKSMNLAILTSSYICREYLNTITCLYIILVVYLVNSMFVVINYYKSFKEFEKNECV